MTDAPARAAADVAPPPTAQRGAAGRRPASSGVTTTVAVGSTLNRQQRRAGTSRAAVLSVQRVAGNRAAAALVGAGGGRVRDPAAGPSSTPAVGVPVQREFELPDLSLPDLELPDIDIPDIGDLLRLVPGYDALTLVIGFDPATGRAVEATPAQLARAVFGLVPGGSTIADGIAELDVVQKAADLIGEQVRAADLTATRLARVADEAWAEVDLTPRLGIVDENVEIVGRHVQALVDDATRVAEGLVDAVLAIAREAAVERAEALLAGSETAARGWELTRSVMGHDPLRGVEVHASTEQIIEHFLLLIGRGTELEQMRERGTLAETAAWLDAQLATFDSIRGDFEALVADAFAALTPAELPSLVDNLTELARGGAALIQRVADFATSVAAEVLAIVKRSLLGVFDEHARQVPGFHLVTVLAGANPITGATVERTPENVIKGFLTLLPGGEQQYEQLAETGVIGEAAGRIQGAIDDLGITREFVSTLFGELLTSFTIDDLVDLPAAIDRVVARFSEPIDRLLGFVRVVSEEVFTLVLELMGFPSELLERIIANALAAFDRIQADPARFLTNLLEALKLGFASFFDHIAGHLLSGLAGWLFRTLEDAGIRVPDDLGLASVLDLVFQVLGLSEQRLWAKLADRVGPETVERIRGALDSLRGIWAFVADVERDGIAAVWQYVTSRLSALWDLILEQAQDWVMTEIVEAMVGKLLSMLDPTGIMAVVNSFLALIRAIESVAEYLRDMLDILDRYVSTIAEIAQGSLESGAQQLEAGLASSLPVAIGFLANQAGLGDVAAEVQRIVRGVQGVVDEALDWLVDQAVAAGGALLGAVGAGPAGEPAAAEAAAGAPGAQAAAGDADADLDPTDHRAVATRAVARLEAVEGDGTYDGVRAAMAAEARRLETTYTALLEPGIALAVTFGEPSADAADEDVDFHVRIGPNTTDADGSNATADLPGHARRTRPGQGDADLLVGAEGRYSSLSGRQDPLYESDRARYPFLWLEAEHILPRFVIDRALRGMEFLGMPSRGVDYGNAPAILVYERAADIKTTTYDPDVQSVEDEVDDVTAPFRDAGSTPAMRSGAHQDLVRMVERHSQGSIESTIAATREEDGTWRSSRGNDDVRPTPEAIRRAGAAQLEHARREVLLHQAFTERAAAAAPPTSALNLAIVFRDAAGRGEVKDTSSPEPHVKVLVPYTGRRRDRPEEERAARKTVRVHFRGEAGQVTWTVEPARQAVAATGTGVDAAVAALEALSVRLTADAAAAAATSTAAPVAGAGTAAADDTGD